VTFIRTNTIAAAELRHTVRRPIGPGDAGAS
jgi:hypothetical protein